MFVREGDCETKRQERAWRDREIGKKKNREREKRRERGRKEERKKRGEGEK